ncbi:MAG: MFS transporter [Anaerolineae bacterium]|nr:MFS transporter [Anaerolineae bacterium]
MRSASPPASRQPIGALLIVLLIAATCILGMLSTVQSLALIFMELSDQVDRTSILGQITVVQTVAYVMASLLVGTLLSRWGYNRTFLIGAALSAVGLFGFALNADYPAQLITQAILSAGSALFAMSASLYLLIHGWRRLAVWLPIAGLLGQLFVNAAVLEVERTSGFPNGSSGLYLVLTLSAGVLFAAIAFTRLRWRTVMPTGEAIWYYNPIQTLRDRQTWPFLGLMVSVALVNTAVVNSLQSVVFMADGSAQDVANWSALGWFCGMLGIALWGWLVGRISIERLLLLTFAGTVVGAVLLWLLPMPIVYAGIQFFLSVVGSLALLYVLDRSGIHHLPSLMGLGILAATVLNPLLQFAMSTIASALGASLALTLLIIGLGLFSGACWWWAQRNTGMSKKSSKKLDPDETVNSKDHITQEIPIALRGGKGR